MNEIEKVCKKLRIVQPVVAKDAGTSEGAKKGWITKLAGGLRGMFGGGNSTTRGEQWKPDHIAVAVAAHNAQKAAGGTPVVNKQVAPKVAVPTGNAQSEDFKRLKGSNKYARGNTEFGWYG